MKRPSLLFALLVVVVFAAGVFAWPNVEGRLVLQKIVTDLAMPYGVVWFGLAIACVLAWRGQQRILLILCLALFLFHTLAGNGFLSQYFALTLEGPFEKLRPLQEEPFDKVVVLGGGTGEARNGRAQAGKNGERVVLAARMYHAGLARVIVCTGERILSVGGDKLDPAEEATEILTGLGVPAEAIETIGGMNTIAEMRILGQQIKPGERIGLITSAWHMSRALRLAKGQGLQLEPLPANFITDYQIQMTPMDVVPTSQATADTTSVLREYLAWVVGR